MAGETRSAVLERSTAAEAVRKAKAPGAQSAASAPARKGWRIRRKAGWAEFIVDVWITNLHWVKFGLYKHSRNQAKSRQFTSDMDIFAEVIERGERTRLLGYREDLWRKHAGMDRRLVHSPGTLRTAQSAPSQARSSISMLTLPCSRVMPGRSPRASVAKSSRNGRSASSMTLSSIMRKQSGAVCRQLVLQRHVCAAS